MNFQIGGISDKILEIINCINNNSNQLAMEDI